MDDLRLLRTYLAVVEAGSMADAAVIVGCSGPAVSQQIARLEADLGIELLVRHNQGVVTTPAGEVLVDRARQLLGVATDLEMAVKDAHAASIAGVRVNAFASASLHLISGAITTFRNELPDAKVTLVESYDNERPFDKLVSGDVDLVVAHIYDHVPLAIPEGVKVTDLGYDPMDVVLPKRHRLSSKRSIRLQDLRDEDWVLFPTVNVATISIMHAAADAGFVPRSGFEAADYQVMWALVGAGIGIALLPRMVTSGFRYPNCDVRPLTGSRLGRTICIAIRRASTSQSLEVMSEAITEQFLRSR
jgi:DNA-binding transcriptional LysR family regulator